MTGSLIQIAAYGIHDIYLIGNPQITFFKTVYMRHTNFSMEYLEEQLLGVHNFGGNLSCNLSKAGDLLYKLYLKITLPSVSIQSSNMYNNIKDVVNYNNLYISYNKINLFIDKINYYLIQNLYELLNISNINYTEINSKYELLKKQINYINILNQIQDIDIIFNEKFYIPLNPDNPLYSKIIDYDININLATYLNIDKYYKTYVNSNIMSKDINTYLQQFLDRYSLLLKTFKINIFNQLLFYKKTNDISNRNNIYFGWVENIGHQIINKIEIEIGGKVIDFTDGVRMNIQYQLTNKILHDETFNKLIGNISDLTDFNYNPKSEYTLFIPIEFWFSKYSGISLPLIFLRYHDVKINIKLNDLVNCCYFEKIDDITIENEIILASNVSLIANYIYLENDERKKFAQLEHEYLIDQTQKIDINTNTNIFNFQLSFFNPVKQLFWIIRNQNNIDRLKYFDYSCNYYIDIYEFLNHKDKLIKINTVENNLSDYISIGDTIEIVNSIYYSGIYIVKNIENNSLFIEYYIYISENYKFNYTNTYIKNNNYKGYNQSFIKKINNINPIKYTTLELNGITLLNKTDDIYHNFIQPYQYNSKSPEYGLNTFSFALSPEELQPSGFCNFNRIDYVSVSYQLNNKYKIDNSILSIYALGYNILKFMYGKAAIVLNI
jgi:hypothetical protein